jgi:hypothetical protein
MKPEDFAGTTPRLTVEDYFLGQTRAWGIFQDRSGRLRRQFTVDIVGEMRDGALILTEDFRYADGATERRTWHIRRLDAHHYEGRADDVIGVARGSAFGQALNWRYVLRLKLDGRDWDLNFDDWMFLQPDGVLINRAVVSKFGFRVGEVTLTFSKPLQANP